MQDHNPEKPPPSPETWDTFEAAYEILPADRQAALRDEARASLVQKGYHRDYLAMLIRPEACHLLAAQAGCSVAPVPPASSAAVVTPCPTGPALGPPLAPDTLCQPAPVATAPAARAPREPPGGVHSVGDGTGQRQLPKPTSSHIRIEDLQETARLLLLYPQYVAQGLAVRSQPGLLAFVALAEHALRIGDAPEVLFADNLRHQRYHVYSEADDAAAQTRLKALGGIDPQRRAQPPPTSEPPALSKDAWCVHELQRDLARHGVHSDVLEQLHREDPAYWTDEHCHALARELAQSQRSSQQATALRRLGDLGTGEDGLAALSLETLECAACGAEGPACVCREDCEDG